ncbi:glycine cleavage system protein H [Streptomyces sp. NBC_01198]|uniref:glycine cleavage system protein H n=1 Tax=Streptomyces sp. NBC_01198 TaxID=2903769 RepID=UPI002E15389A|nr:glycine cleavage system protein H [Streptomyces sp. NBC_01198]
MPVPEELKYSTKHEWVGGLDDLDGGAGVLTIGITQLVVDEVGEIVYLRLPDVGTRVDAGDICGEVETSDLTVNVFAPVAGVVTEVNQGVVDEPRSVSDDPFGRGWLFRLRVEEPPSDLLDSVAYNQHTSEPS